MSVYNLETIAPFLWFIFNRCVYFFLFFFCHKSCVTVLPIRCKKRVLDTMIDLFGRSIMLCDIDENHYEFSVTVNDNGIVFLAQQYIDVIQIISPFEIRDRVRKTLIEAVNLYK